MTGERVGAAAFFAERRAILMVLAVPVVIIALAASVIVFGSATHRAHIGSVAALESATSEYLRLQGVDVSQVAVAGSVSTIDPLWGEFFAQPTTHQEALRFQSAYGFAHFKKREITVPGHPNPVQNFQWVIVAIGTSQVGCAPPDVVPPRVIAGFHAYCSPSTSS